MYMKADLRAANLNSRPRVGGGMGASVTTNGRKRKAKRGDRAGEAAEP